MKVLFSADWHIKLKQKNVPLDWAKNRFRLMFKQLHELERTVDMHVIGGDIFDTVPTIEELQLYFEYIAEVKCKTIIFAGNHESVKKHTTFFTQLKEVSNKLNPLVEIIDDFYSLESMDFIPYNCLKQEYPEFTGNILFTHVRGEIPPYVKAEVPLSIFEKWAIVFAGDLHSHSNSQRNIVYPGSPVTTSFHRNPVDTGVIILDSSNLGYTWHKLEVPQLIRKTIEAGEPMPPGDYDHYIYEVTGDMSQLGSVKDSELLDKKIVKKSTDCALILDPEATVQEELSEYLRYIVMLDDKSIEEILAEYNNNIKGIMS